ncbi:hypothetical protein [Paraburkholderia sp. 2C]
MLSGVSNNQRSGYGVDPSDDESSGGPMINMINGANNILNTPALSSVGQALDRMGPLGKLIHVIPDFFIGELGSKLGEGIAHLFGEQGQVKTHFEKEWLGRDGGLNNDGPSGKDRASRDKDVWYGSDQQSTRDAKRAADFPLPGLNGDSTRIATNTVEVANGGAI